MAVPNLNLLQSDHRSQKVGKYSVADHRFGQQLCFRRISFRRIALTVPILIVLGMVTPSYAQGQTLHDADEDLLRWVYSHDGEPFGSFMRGVNRASYPLFVLTTSFEWGTAVVSEDNRDYRNAYLLTLSEGATVGTVILLKNIVKRTRPFRKLSDIESRSRSSRTSRLDPYAFPSGHAAISFSIATSLAMGQSKWYVVAPAYLLASSISLSRIWHGMHFPSDIIAGAVIGSGTTILVWVMKDSLTPQRWRDTQGNGQELDGPKFRLVLSI